MDRIDTISGVIVTPLMIIEGQMGSVLRAQRNDEEGFKGFGECYFSTIGHGLCKGWKRHHRMTLNLIVPVGEIQFMAFDDRIDSPTSGRVGKISLSVVNYGRLTIPPMVWLAFKGASNGVNMLLNVADLIHDPLEADNRAADHPDMPRWAFGDLPRSDPQRASI